MRESRTDHRMIRVYDSIAELAAHADKYGTNARHRDNVKPSWYQADWSETMTMARDGWTEHLNDVVDLAAQAVEMASAEHMVDSFIPQWDVTGAEVDVARFLSGEPECMIDFPLTQTSKSGRVITLAVNVGYSAAISTATMVKRGMLISAFALALSRLGHSIEMWGVLHVAGDSKNHDTETFVKVKGVDDELDPAHILFAYAHPAFSRRLMFVETETYPAGYKTGRRTIRWPDVKHEKTVMPDEIRLPELKSGHDVPDADEFLRKYLDELGLLAE